MTNPAEEHDDATARLARLMHASVDSVRPDLHARAASALLVGRRSRRRRRAGSALGAVAVVAAVGSFGYVVAASGGPESSTPTGFAGDPSSSTDPTPSPTPSPTALLTASRTASPTASPSPSNSSSTDCVQNPTPYSGCALVATVQRVAQTAAERHHFEQLVTENADRPPLVAVLVSGAGGS